MPWRRKTRPAAPPGGNDPALCGRRISKTRACSRHATHHHPMAWAESPTGYKGVMLCERHSAECTTSEDHHLLAPICHDANPWWQHATEQRPGSCYHPDEEAQLLAQLSTITRGVKP